MTAVPPTPPPPPVLALFAPPGAAWRPVSPRLVRVRRLVALLWAAPLTLGAAVAAGLVDPVLIPLALVLVLAAVVVVWVLIGRTCRSWGYAERAEDLSITSGVMFRRLVVVPYGRMQYVDVTAGPLQRAHGIATVQLHTAAPVTAARIPGLPTLEAQRLRDQLTERGNAEAAGL